MPRYARPRTRRPELSKGHHYNWTSKGRPSIISHADRLPRRNGRVQRARGRNSRGHPCCPVRPSRTSSPADRGRPPPPGRAAHRRLDRRTIHRHYDLLVQERAAHRRRGRACRGAPAGAYSAPSSAEASLRVPRRWRSATASSRARSRRRSSPPSTAAAQDDKEQRLAEVAPVAFRSGEAPSTSTLPGRRPG